jgi:hypothetical protein
MVIIDNKLMKLFHIIKEDAANKHNAAYIVKANSPELALRKVNLTPTDVEELNKEYKSQSFPRYSVSIEEIDLTDKTFYEIH